jgi:hypothetical protein
VNWVVSFYFFLAVSYHSCFFSSSLGAFMEEEGEANYLLPRLVASWKRKKKKQSIISYRQRVKTCQKLFSVLGCNVLHGNS